MFFVKKKDGGNCSVQMSNFWTIFILPAFQNGRFALFKMYAGEKRFPLQNRIGRYLFLGTTEQKLTKEHSDLFGQGIYTSFFAFILV